MDFLFAESLVRLWSFVHGLIERLGWADLVRLDAAPTMHLVLPLAITILLIPVVVRWSGSLVRLTIIVLALLIPVWVVLPAL
jgi:hypothetical protein